MGESKGFEAPSARPTQKQPPPTQPTALSVVAVPTIEIRPAGGSFFVKSDAPSVWSQPGTWISIIALAISVLGLFVTIFDKWWGHQKDIRSREQSIQDEFWLRKVLFPTAIEPVMTFTANVIAQMPSASATEIERLKYFNDFQAQHRDYAKKLILVATIWPSLYKNLESAFEQVEDTVADYCQLPDSVGGNAPGRTLATVVLNEALGKFYIAVREHQNAIGKKVKSG